MRSRASFFVSGEVNFMVHRVERRREVDQAHGSSVPRIDGDGDAVNNFEKRHLCVVVVRVF